MRPVGTSRISRERRNFDDSTAVWRRRRHEEDRVSTLGLFNFTRECHNILTYAGALITKEEAEGWPRHEVKRGVLGFVIAWVN